MRRGEEEDEEKVIGEGRRRSLSLCRLVPLVWGQHQQHENQLPRLGRENRGGERRSRGARLFRFLPGLGALFGPDLLVVDVEFAHMYRLRACKTILVSVKRGRFTGHGEDRDLGREEDRTGLRDEEGPPGRASYTLPPSYPTFSSSTPPTASPNSPSSHLLTDPPSSFFPSSLPSSPSPRDPGSTGPSCSPSPRSSQPRTRSVGGSLRYRNGAARRRWRAGRRGGSVGRGGRGGW
jgi:hypothetical protein